jgi:hypothetical protein
MNLTCYACYVGKLQDLNLFCEIYGKFCVKFLAECPEFQPKFIQYIVPKITMPKFMQEIVNVSYLSPGLIRSDFMYHGISPRAWKRLQ